MRANDPTNPAAKNNSPADSPSQEPSVGTSVPGLQTLATGQLPARRRLQDLPLPAELAAAVEISCQHLGFVTAQERNFVTEELKLQYYYGGKDVACLDTPDGRWVVAVGTPVIEDLPQVLQSLQPD